MDEPEIQDLFRRLVLAVERLSVDVEQLKDTIIEHGEETKWEPEDFRNVDN